MIKNEDPFEKLTSKKIIHLKTYLGLAAEKITGKDMAVNRFCFLLFLGNQNEHTTEKDSRIGTE